MAKLLFVYGTLRSGFRHPMADLLARRARHLGAGKVRGRLYRLGRYPGVLEAAGDGEWVRGDVYRLPEDEGEMLRELDRYENGESPLPAFFHRRVTQAWLDSGEVVEAWVYWFRGEVTEEERIWNGDWME